MCSFSTRDLSHLPDFANTPVHYFLPVVDKSQQYIGCHMQQYTFQPELHVMRALLPTLCCLTNSARMHTVPQQLCADNSMC